MIRLQKCLLSHILAPSPTATATPPPIVSLHRLLSATPAPFAAEEYLVSNCGLSGAQALKASKKISHLKSPSCPDAVLAFLAGLGLSRAEVATVITSHPTFLRSNVEKTLAPRVAELSDIGLSRPEIARLVLVSPVRFGNSSFGRNVRFWRQVLGSTDELLRILKFNRNLLGTDLEKVVKPNLAFLQGCGISVSRIPKPFMFRMVIVSTKHLQEALALVDEFGIERDSRAFPCALAKFAITSQQKLDTKRHLLEKLGWSRDDIAQAVRRHPNLLGMSEDRIRRNFEFLTVDVGLEYHSLHARTSHLMVYSFERRLFPRHCLINFLKSKGLVNTKCSFSSIAARTNDQFLRRFVHRYEESIPGLTAAFASSCSGKHVWEHL